MKRRTIDAMRELRLWTEQVIVPMFGITMAIPELRDPAIEKFKGVKESIEKKLKKWFEREDLTELVESSLFAKFTASVMKKGVI